MKRIERMKEIELEGSFYEKEETSPVASPKCKICKFDWDHFHTCRYGYREGTELPIHVGKVFGGYPIRIVLVGDRFLRATHIGYQDGCKVVEHKDGNFEVLHKQVETF